MALHIAKQIAKYEQLQNLTEKYMTAVPFCLFYMHCAKPLCFQYSIYLIKKKKRCDIAMQRVLTKLVMPS